MLLGDEKTGQVGQQRGENQSLNETGDQKNPTYLKCHSCVLLLKSHSSILFKAQLKPFLLSFSVKSSCLSSSSVSPNASFAPLITALTVRKKGIKQVSLSIYHKFI